MHQPRLSLDGRWFRDDLRRSVLLRGVNLGGCSKTPIGVPPLDAADPRGADSVSFVGRPFPLKEADEHLGRLRHWGFNCLRLLTTWEAIEHAGPGCHDETYLDYFAEVVAKAGEHGFHVFIDPHQDAWSRFSGGDGAPAWTLALAGFDLAGLDASEAAVTISGRWPDYPAMVWPNNWYRLACATMFSLFFAGEALAPRTTVDGEHIQQFLQRHFLEAIGALATRLRGFPHVLGYDSLNEPSAGYLGVQSLARPLRVYNSAPQLTGLESLSVPAGFSKEVPYLTRRHLRQVQTGTTLLNPRGASAWTDPDRDVWRTHGVWDLDAGGRPRVVRDDYFAGVHFARDGLRPFLSRYARTIRAAHPGAILFLEGEPGSGEPPEWDGDMPVVNASHWYDLLTLTTRHYDPEATLVWGSDQTVQGRDEVRASFSRQIAALVEDSRTHLNGCPTLIGEFGLPFDLDGGESFRTGDFRPQIEALTAYHDALDANLVHSALWNYNPDNSNERGDGWNLEDLSIFSRDQRTRPDEPDSGGRAVEGFCRPTLRCCAGLPLSQIFHRESGEYSLEIEASGSGAPTIVHLPRIHYPGVPRFTVTAGRVEHDPANQILRWLDVGAGRQSLKVAR